MTENEIRNYAVLMSELGLTGLEIDETKGSVRLERQSSAPAGQSFAPAPEAAPKKEEGDGLTEIKSPIVGVFYQAPMENAAPFVQVGDRVKKGSVLAIVEAMKLMNEIVSDREGIIREVLVENGQTVDYNCPLFKIEEIA